MMMPKRLLTFNVIAIFLLVYTLTQLTVSDMVVPLSYESADLHKSYESAKSTKIGSALNVHKWDQLPRNQSTTIRESIDPKKEMMQRGDSKSSREDAPTAADEEKNQMMENDRNVWESLWRHYVFGRSTETQEVSMQDRMQLWRQLLKEPLHPNATNQSTALGDLHTLFPLPKDSSQHYNEDAYNSLVSSILQAQREGRTFTVVANGGSATGGAGNPSLPPEQRYYYQFAAFLNRLLSNNENGSNATVQWVGQGHGFRNSLHSAIFFHSFIPVDADLLLWEFSINDATLLWDFSINDAKLVLEDEYLIQRSAREYILAWLSEVERMKRPPKVILIYKWDPEFLLDEATNKTLCRVFDAHGSLAREFSFVVGHIHVGHYINELGVPECSTWKSCPLLGDRCHVNAVGHLAVAFLLLDFLKTSKTLSVPQEAKGGVVADSRDNYWDCGNETETKRVLRESMTIATNSSIEWRSPVGAWTFELPVVDQVTSRLLVTGPTVGPGSFLGKQDPNRQDRQQVTPLYMCDMNTSNSFSLIAPLEPMTNVRVVLLTFRWRPVLKTSGIAFRLNGADTASKGELTPLRTLIKSNIVADWPCGLPCPWGTTADVYAFIFDTVQPAIHSVELCTPKKFSNSPEVQSLAFW